MLNIQSLAYDDIRSNLVNYIKSTDEFKDYNFDASGISTLINLLAYNTHYFGYYVKMMLNESFIDSAKLDQSMRGKAKLVGYTPRNSKSATAELFVKISLGVDPDDKKVIIPKGSKFSATSPSGEKKTFVSTDEFTLYDRTIELGEFVYRNTTSPATPLIVKEGDYSSWKYIVDTGIANQAFVIKQANVDYDTITVKIYDTSTSSNFIYYTKASFENVLNSNSLVYFITTNEDGYYEVFFGDGVFGKKLDNGNKIEIEYIVTSGSAGNGVGTLSEWSADGIISGRPLVIDLDYPRPIAYGGADAETVDNLRFTIPNHYKRQNRIVTEDDYKTLILSEYRNIDSINVWGGEKNDKREYGKVFVCIKPKFAAALSTTAKNDIKNNLLKKYSVVGSEPVFVDPEFIDLDMIVNVSYDKTKTALSRGEIETIVSNRITEYNATKLNIFDNSYSEVDLLNFIRISESSIKSVYIIKTMNKDLTVKYSNPSDVYTKFGNAISHGSVNSNILLIGGTSVVIKDIDGKLYFMLYGTTTKFQTASIGTCDYASGTIKFKLPQLLTMPAGEFDKSSYGILRLTVSPDVPDVNTYLNNIIRITKSKVNING